MRLPALVVIATVGLTAAQVPAIQTQPVTQPQQPPRDVARRAEPTGTARIKGRIVTADRGQAVRRATVSLSAVPSCTRQYRRKFRLGVGRRARSCKRGRIYSAATCDD